MEDEEIVLDWNCGFGKLGWEAERGGIGREGLEETRFRPSRNGGAFPSSGGTGTLVPPALAILTCPDETDRFPFRCEVVASVERVVVEVEWGEIVALGVGLAEP